MRKNIIVFVFYIVSIHWINAQSLSTVTGKIIDNFSENSIENANIFVTNTSIHIKSALDGSFIINNFPQGEYILEIILNGYETKKIHLNISENNKTLDLGIIRLMEKINHEIDHGFISLNEEDLHEDDNGETNVISGLLVSSKDIFSKTVAYEFSPTFFKPRNLGSEYSKVLLNGISMNKFYNGRPQWSNWGGLNDVLRNQEFILNAAPSDFTFSGISG